MSEERDIFFGNLNRVGVGVKEVEDFVERNQERVKNQSTNLKEKIGREIVTKTMMMKTLDNKLFMKRMRMKRNQQPAIEET